MTIIDEEKLRKKIAKKASSFSQGDLSQKSGIAQNRISEYLSGKRAMSLDNLKLLCGALGLKLIFNVDVKAK